MPTQTYTRRGALTVHVKMDGVKETLRAFNRLERTASKELRDETIQIAESLVGDLRAAAIIDSRQSALLAPTVKARRDRVPNVSAGGSKRVGRQGEPAGGLIFSSEFGQNKKSGWYAAPRFRGSLGRQWHPHRGAASYWFYKTVDRETPEIFRRWFAVCDRLLNRWGAGG